MAHFAQLNNNNEVIQVIVVSDERAPGNFPESEEPGISFCKSIFGEDTIWKQTSYNSNFRVRYAGIGYTYSEEYDAFIAPQPFNSWILNLETLEWNAPNECPNDDKSYDWDEENIAWVEITKEQE